MNAWSRTDKIACAVLALVLLASCTWTVHPWYDKATDAALYVSTARSIAVGDGYSYLGAPFVVRPPGFSFLIAPLVGAVGVPDFARLNGLVAGFAVIGLLAAFALVRPRLGGPLAAVLAIALWSNPGFQRLSSQVLSDVPGLTLLLLTLVADRRARARGGWPAHLVLGLTLVAGVYVRTLNVLLIPAILCDRWFAPRSEDEPARRLAPLATALALPIVAFAPWIVRSAGIEVPTPTEQVYLHSYGTAMLHADPGDPASHSLTLSEHAARSLEQCRSLLGEVGSRLGAAEQTSLAFFVAGLLLALTALAWLGRRDTTTWLTLAVLFVLGTYFTFKPRLALPLWFLAALLAVEALHDLGARFVSKRLLRLSLGTALAVLAWVDFDAWSWQNPLETKHTELIALGERLNERVDAGSAGAAPIGHHIGLFTERPIYSLQIVAERQGPEAALALLQRHAVTHVAQDSRRRLGWDFARLGFRPEAVGPFNLFAVR